MDFFFLCMVKMADKLPFPVTTKIFPIVFNSVFNLYFFTTFLPLMNICSIFRHLVVTINHCMGRFALYLRLFVYPFHVS
jgi:hypothetical protein